MKRIALIGLIGLIPFLAFAAVNWDNAPAALKALGCVDESSCERAYDTTTDPEQLKLFWEFADKGGAYNKEEQQVLKTTLDVLLDELKALQQLTDPAEIKRQIIALAEKLRKEDPDSARRLVDEEKIKEAEDEEEGEQAIRDGKIKPCADAGVTDPEGCGQLLFKAVMADNKEALAHFRQAAIRYFHMTAEEFEEMVEEMKRSGPDGRRGEDEEDEDRGGRGGLITIYLPEHLWVKYGKKMTFRSEAEVDAFFRRVDEEERKDRGILPDIIKGKRDQQKELVARCVKDTGRSAADCERLATDFFTNIGYSCPVFMPMPLPSSDCYYGDKLFITKGEVKEALCSSPTVVCPGDPDYDKKRGGGRKICPAMPTVTDCPAGEFKQCNVVEGCGEYCSCAKEYPCPSVMPRFCDPGEEPKYEPGNRCQLYSCLKQEKPRVEFPYTFSGPDHLTKAQRTARTIVEARDFCNLYNIFGSGKDGLAAECVKVLASADLPPEVPKDPEGCIFYKTGKASPYIIDTTDKRSFTYPSISDTLYACATYTNYLTTGSKSLCATMGTCTSPSNPPPKPIDEGEVTSRLKDCMVRNGSPLPIVREGKNYSTISELEALAGPLTPADSLRGVIYSCISVAYGGKPTPIPPTPVPTPPKGQKYHCFGAQGLCSNILDTDDSEYNAAVREADTECANVLPSAPGIWRQGAGDSKNLRAFGLPDIEQCKRYRSGGRPGPGQGDAARAYRGGLYYSSGFETCMNNKGAGAVVTEIRYMLEKGQIPPDWGRFGGSEARAISDCEGSGGWTGGGGTPTGACSDPAIRALFTTGAEGAHQMSDPNTCFNSLMTEYVGPTKTLGKCTGQDVPVQGCSLSTGTGGTTPGSNCPADKPYPWQVLTGPCVSDSECRSKPGYVSGGLCLPSSGTGSGPYTGTGCGQYDNNQSLCQSASGCDWRWFPEAGRNYCMSSSSTYTGGGGTGGTGGTGGGGSSCPSGQYWCNGACVSNTTSCGYGGGTTSGACSAGTSEALCNTYSASGCYWSNGVCMSSGTGGGTYTGGSGTYYAPGCGGLSQTTCGQTAGCYWSNNYCTATGGSTTSGSSGGSSSGGGCGMTTDPAMCSTWSSCVWRDGSCQWATTSSTYQPNFLAQVIHILRSLFLR